MNIFFRLKAVLFQTVCALKRSLRFILTVLIFPKNCLLCGMPTRNEPLCSNCLDRTIYGGLFLSVPRCAKCGKQLISEMGLCTSCRGDSILTEVESVFPLYAYRFWAKDLLFLWKTQNERTFSPLFAKILYEVWKKRFNGIPIVPVPPRPGKIRKKGWDQIDELSHFLYYYHKVPVMKLLRRTEKKQQKKLNRQERLLTKRNFVPSKPPEKLFYDNKAPTEVVILDDILTTGSTLQKCAVELKNLGIKTVYALTLFIVE